MNDKWIKKMALEHDMIVPFKDKQIAEGQISSGLSSYGYDATLSNTFKIFTNVHSGTVDVKNFDDSNFIEKKAKEVLLPGNSFMLGVTEEVFCLPRDVTAICVGKSSAHLSRTCSIDRTSLPICIQDNDLGSRFSASRGNRNYRAR